MTLNVTWSTSLGITCALFSAVLALGLQTHAQNPVARLAEQEAGRRQQKVITAADDIQRADTLLRQGKTEESLRIFESVFETLPAAPLTKEIKDVALEGYIQAGCLRAREFMIEGKRGEASKLLDRLLTISPSDKRVTGLRAEFDDPDRWPPALTESHVARVKDVERLLTLAGSAFEIGDFDRALAFYQNVLRIDPANSAARRGMEKAEQERSRHFKSAYDHTRAKFLSEVSRKWETQVPPTASDVSAMFGTAASALSAVRSGREQIIEKLRAYVMPKVEFSGATISEVVELLRIRSRDLDPSGKGIDFVVNVPPEAGNKPISLTMENVPMDEVLRYVTEMASVAYRVEDFAVQITSIGERNSSIVLRTFRVPPDFIQNSPAAPNAEAPANDPFAQPPAAGGGLTLRRMGAREFLESRGVQFPDGTSASFNAATSTLVVRNTVSNMEMVEMLVEMAAKNAPKMAVVTVRMVEVNQTNLDELGFDWLLGGIGLQSNSLFVGGGTSGSGIPHNATNYPFGNLAGIPAITDGAGNVLFPTQPVQSAVGGPVPLGVPITAAGGAGGGGPVTSGLRSGGFAVSSTALDSLLATGSATAANQQAPGFLSVAGIYGTQQFQTVLRGLSQKKGVDINASPSVTTKSGVKATVDITREFIYPTEFDPPQLPQATLASLAALPIATPTTPTAFEMRKTGVVLELEPVIEEDARSVEVNISAELTDFEGFVNYGSPIYSPARLNFLPINGGGGAAITSWVPLSAPEQLITPNLILQPIFKTQKAITSVKVWDGQTVVLGGAKIQRHTLVDDKVPVIGDIPMVGRLFRSNAKQTETKNIIIFVTVEVIDPSGQKINQQTAAIAPAAP